MNNRILPITRWVAAAVIPFLVVAFVILYLLPTDTERLFAWRLQPTMSAMMLGAAYAGGVYFFAGVLHNRQWHRVKVGFLPVTAFASLLGIATVLHWDRFNHDHVSFIAWAGLYFSTPLIVLAVWWRNRVQDDGQSTQDDRHIPQAIRLAMGAVGILTLGISAFLFLQPAVMVDHWFWTLTPLTARVLGAMFALPAMVGLGIAADARWSAATHILQAQAFSIALILLAAARAHSEFDWDNLGSWLFVGGLALMLVGIVALLRVMRR